MSDRMDSLETPRVDPQPSPSRGLAPQAVGLLVTLLTAVAALHFLGVRGLAVGALHLVRLALLLVVPFALEAQSVHLHGHRVHCHDLRTGDLGHFQPQLLVGVQSRGVQHHVPSHLFLLQPVNEDAGLHIIGDGECW